jgi:hypothetical protein
MGDDTRRPTLLTRALEWLSGPTALPRLGVVFCVVVATAAAAARYPAAAVDADDLASRNAALDYADREIAGGNGIVADQTAMYEARSWIPRDGTYRVVTGTKQPAFSDLTIPWVALFANSFLLPRRQTDRAPWILCYGCDEARFPGARLIWKDGEGISLLRVQR